ncbi:MAG: hypothetical protein BMS9Abin05_1902 [Rhodothermia bacterium]|nr:MAG: hypothetical protein BMS9Abin05_1902 [Rhodothermia bacterium]
MTPVHHREIASNRLLRIQLDDELFADILWNVFAVRVVEELPPKPVSIDFKPRGAPSRAFYCILDNKKMSATRTNRDDISGAYLCRRNIDNLVVHHDVSVVHELPCLPSRHRKSQTEYCVVQSGLEEFQQVLTSNSFLSGRFLKEIAKLSLQQSVGMFCLLLLFELDCVFAVLLPPPATVLPGWMWFTFQRFAGTENRLFESPSDFLFWASVSGHMTIPLVWCFKYKRTGAVSTPVAGLMVKRSHVHVNLILRRDASLGACSHYVVPE